MDNKPDYDEKLLDVIKQLRQSVESSWIGGDNQQPEDKSHNKPKNPQPPKFSR